MRRKIEEMGQRIRQLEDALAIMQASVSSERRPLLQDEYRAKLPFERSEEGDVTGARVSELADELGTLDLGDGGRARYLGRPEETQVRCILGILYG